MKLIAPITYQGGKQKIAGAILNHIQLGDKFYDLCCGSGAISVELINRGYPVEQIVMLDKGPWGLFWKAVGEGSFDLNKFQSYCQSVPLDRSKIKDYMHELFSSPVDEDAMYIFLLLQASTFGGAAVWIEGDKWKKSGGFRNYWMPTATSNRRSPVNPMMPLPETLFQRIALVCEKMKGIVGICGDIQEIDPVGMVYIDPPYQGTAVYGFDFDVVKYALSLKCKCYISEGKALSDQAYLITKGSKKGGMSGDRDKPHEEWLSEFN